MVASDLWFRKVPGNHEESTQVASTNIPLDVEGAVHDRYTAAAQQAEQSLCCPVDYDPKYLEVLPRELLERDYGCGNPSRYLQPGETVLDLGSGGGKICYIAAQVVGAEGRVIGVDVNDEMLGLARRFQPEISTALGYDNTEFRKGRIQDLALDLERFESYLAENAIRGSNDWLRAEAVARELREQEPMIASDSVDVVVSNCVLNLVRREHRQQLFAEMFRVLKRGGRVVISDIVSDEPVPQRLQDDPQLWSGCLSGAFVEDELLRTFEEQGFYGVELVARQDDAWATIEGLEFRSVTVRAYKGKQGACLDHNQAVIYKGPWRSVTDDDGHVLRRGERMAVCEKTFNIYTRAPYAEDILPVPPHEEVAADEAPEFDCRRNAVRSPSETKGQGFRQTQLPSSDCCGPDSCC
ncbi:MAG: methyltransferase domain-containing protein [Planctomycetota bacterium]|nr:MAG: methyltransferase domain-containing protein [Planctomycetota bacterium]REJ92322.1 MAG: methyltransferase domain-containing protein [Planctomycetota bacterium]REK30301.1 MAG: methyltransferase domain-containing protein [Planctomycetota bacterium]REK43513.1 MAG: methyltransferase domain-containing protein [Planctomycetota bacterium]